LSSVLGPIRFQFSQKRAEFTDVFVICNHSAVP
jgi:hypothetical protein